MLLLQAQSSMHILIQNVMPTSKAVSKVFLLRNWLEFTAFEWTTMTKLANGVCKVLLVKVSCNMSANNTITTASSSSSGMPRRPTSLLNSKYLFLFVWTVNTFRISIYFAWNGILSFELSFCFSTVICFQKLSWSNFSSSIMLCSNCYILFDLLFYILWTVRILFRLIIYCLNYNYIQFMISLNSSIIIKIIICTV